MLKLDGKVVDKITEHTTVIQIHDISAGFQGVGDRVREHLACVLMKESEKGAWYPYSDVQG